jgi:ParB family chromosome partitioning protein
MKKSINIPEQRLEVTMRPVGELEPYARNAREHSDVQIKALAESIRTFGFTNPVLIHSSGRIIAGHGRVLAAKKAGLEQVPCISLDHLDEVKLRAYTIADNQLPAMASWQYDVLAVEIEELRDEGFSLETLGFSGKELDELLGSPDAPPEIPDEEAKKPDSDTTICPKCHHEFVL